VLGDILVTGTQIFVRRLVDRQSFAGYFSLALAIAFRMSFPFPSHRTTSRSYFPRPAFAHR